MPGRTDYAAPRLDQEIREGGKFPIRNAEMVVYTNATCGECVVCLAWHKLLVTCDSAQHYDKDGLISPLGKLVVQLDFEHLISGHGTPKIGGARQALAVHVAKQNGAPLTENSRSVCAQDNQLNQP